MKTAFVGCGNMGAAIVRGLVGKGIVPAASISCVDKIDDNVVRLANDCGVVPKKTIAEACAVSDVIVVAVKPQGIEPVLAEIKDSRSKARFCISVAAGVTLGRLKAGVGSSFKVARVMPNVPALVGRGIAGIYSDEPDAATLAEEMFKAVGDAVVLEAESQIDTVTGVSGSGPGFIFLAMDALVEGGVKMGLPREIAQKLAAYTVAGAGEVAISTGKAPLELRDMVASPGGTTLAGLAVLEQKAFHAALVDAVEAATRRSRELG